MRITNSKRQGTKYASRQIILSPTGKLADFVGEIAGKYTESGHNPRRFVSFNEAKLKALKNKSRRLAMAKRFSIAIKDDKFDIDAAGTAEKVVKLLCNKGMIDPFENSAVEVPSAKQWL